jgi:hypothetical protein
MTRSDVRVRRVVAGPVDPVEVVDGWLEVVSTTMQPAL